MTNIFQRGGPTTNQAFFVGLKHHLFGDAVWFPTTVLVSFITPGNETSDTWARRHMAPENSPVDGPETTSRGVVTDISCCRVTATGQQQFWC